MNVIIVDIRALDTNGEITVLVVVGLCIYGLLRAPARGAHDAATSPILRVIARFAVPLTLLVALRIFSRATTIPGGGFIAGVLLAAAGAMYLLAFGIAARGAGRAGGASSVVGLLHRGAHRHRAAAARRGVHGQQDPAPRARIICRRRRSSTSASC